MIETVVALLMFWSLTNVYELRQKQKYIWVKKVLKKFILNEKAK